MSTPFIGSAGKRESHDNSFDYLALLRGFCLAESFSRLAFRRKSSRKDNFLPRRSCSSDLLGDWTDYFGYGVHICLEDMVANLVERFWVFFLFALIIAIWSLVIWSAASLWIAVKGVY